MKKHVIKGLLISSVVAVSGQASAHVSYTPALIDQLGDATSLLHLAASNQTAVATQNLTATSNAGFAESHNATIWGNSHDSKFQWFSLSAPATISFSLTGNAINAVGTTPVPPGTANQIINPVTGVATTADTFQPGFNLYSGVVPYLSHEGAYQASNTGFAPWSSWAWEALPTSQGGAGGTANSSGNPIVDTTYTVGSGSLNGFANGTVITGPTSAAFGGPGHMGVIGSNSGLIPGDTVTMSDNQAQTTFADGSALTNHTGTLTLVADAAVNDDGSLRTDGAAGTSITASSTGKNNLTTTLTLPAGVYTLQVAGNNQADYTALLADAILTGMGGSEGYQTNSAGLYIQPNSNLAYYDTASSTFTNTASGTTQANSVYTGPLGTPVAGFIVAASPGHTYNGTGLDTTAGSAYQNSWVAVENYAKAYDRFARPYTIALNSVTPSAVPVPAAVWLFLSGFMGLLGFSKHRNRRVA